MPGAAWLKLLLQHVPENKEAGYIFRLMYPAPLLENTLQPGLATKLQREIAIVHIPHQQTLALQVSAYPFAQDIYEAFQFGSVGRLHPLEARAVITEWLVNDGIAA
jgi:hypothetical protein